MQTDILSALSLYLEPPEQDLLPRKPRNIKGDRLANARLIFHAYGCLGVIQCLCAMTMSFWFLRRHGVPFSSLVLSYTTPEALTPELLARAQTVYFFTLVIRQWGNLLATCTRKLSIFQHTPALNWYIVPTALGALVLGMFFSAVPWFWKIFQTRLVPIEYIFIPMAFGVWLLCFDGMRKFFVRRYPKGLLARIAW